MTSYYQNLFGPPKVNNFTIIEDWVDDIPQVSNMEKDILTPSFTKPKVKEAIFQMEYNKVLGPEVSLLNSIKFFGKSLKLIWWYILPQRQVSSFFPSTLYYYFVTKIWRCYKNTTIQIDLSFECELREFLHKLQQINMLTQKVIQS